MRVYLTFNSDWKAWVWGQFTGNPAFFDIRDEAMSSMIETYLQNEYPFSWEGFPSGWYTDDDSLEKILMWIFLQFDRKGLTPIEKNPARRFCRIVSNAYEMASRGGIYGRPLLADDMPTKHVLTEDEAMALAKKAAEKQSVTKKLEESQQTVWAPGTAKFLSGQGGQTPQNAEPLPGKKIPLPASGIDPAGAAKEGKVSQPISKLEESQQTVWAPGTAKYQEQEKAALAEWQRRQNENQGIQSRPLRMEYAECLRIYDAMSQQERDWVNTRMTGATNRAWARNAENDARFCALVSLEGILVPPVMAPDSQIMPRAPRVTVAMEYADCLRIYDALSPQAREWVNYQMTGGINRAWARNAENDARFCDLVGRTQVLSFPDSLPGFVTVEEAKEAAAKRSFTKKLEASTGMSGLIDSPFDSYDPRS